MKQTNGLYAYRRHTKTCKFFGPGGREVRSDKCDCTFHLDGVYRGRRPRESLKTRNRQIADRRVAEKIQKIDAAIQACERSGKPAHDVATMGRTVSEAADRFLQRHGFIGADGKYSGDSAHGTWRKYRNTLRLLVTFCERAGIKSLDEVTIDHLEDFRHSRGISLITWKVELQTLRTFFTYCVKHKWLASNPAQDLQPPRNIKPNEVVPYTREQESLILSACDLIGGGIYNRSGAGYEQLRARAMVMLLRATALRISDVCTVRRDAVFWDGDAATWRIIVRTQKSGEAVHLPIPGNLKLLLDALPLPRNAAQDCPYYFWNGQTSRRAVVGIAERTLSAVFKKSGVKKAHAHRYRHTLATRLLEQGATFEQVADILGNSPAVVRKHYGKWSKGRQQNIDRLMQAHHQSHDTVPVTFQSHEKMGAVN